MGVKSMIRSAPKAERFALAEKLFHRYWSNLTVRQANFLHRYIRLASV